MEICPHIYTALPDVMRYKNPTSNPLPACGEGAKMYLIRAKTAVVIFSTNKSESGCPPI